MIRQRARELATFLYNSLYNSMLPLVPWVPYGSPVSLGSPRFLWFPGFPTVPLVPWVPHSSSGSPRFLWFPGLKYKLHGGDGGGLVVFVFLFLYLVFSFFTNILFSKLFFVLWLSFWKVYIFPCFLFPCSFLVLLYLLYYCNNIIIAIT